MSEHTETPWETSIKGKGVGIIGPQSNNWPLGEHIAHMTSGRPNLHANAAFIVRAVNNVDALQAAAQAVLDKWDNKERPSDAFPELRQALSALNDG